MAEAPRCPLGFTGTPPIGHPSIPGMGAKSPGIDTSGASGSAASTTGAPRASGVLSTLSPYNWSPSTLLVVDGIFLALCVVIALYLPDIKRALGGSAASSPAGAAAPSAVPSTSSGKVTS